MDVEQALFEGKPLPTDAELVVGEDFFEDDPDPEDSSYRDTGDPISFAVGTPGYMANHVVHDCYREFPDGARTEPEEFDRYYFPPGDGSDYHGPAPLLIDVLQSSEPDEQLSEREAKNVAFKEEWCRTNGIRYIVLTDLEDMMLSPEELRERLMGDVPAPAPQEAPQPAQSARKRAGVQHPRTEG